MPIPEPPLLQMQLLYLTLRPSLLLDRKLRRSSQPSYIFYLSNPTILHELFLTKMFLFTIKSTEYHTIHKYSLDCLDDYLWNDWNGNWIFIIYNIFDGISYCYYFVGNYYLGTNEKGKDCLFEVSS